MLGRRPRPLEQVYDAIIKAGGPRPALLPFDLENALAGDYDRLVEAVGQEFGRLDALVHNAAILGTRAPLEHYDVPTWCRVLQVNVTAPFALTQGLLPLLKAGRAPGVLFTTCAQGARGSAYYGAYAVAKGGIERLADVLADEHEGTLRVHCVDPGAMHTSLRALVFPAEGGAQALDGLAAVEHQQHTAEGHGDAGIGGPGVQHGDVGLIGTGQGDRGLGDDGRCGVGGGMGGHGDFSSC